AADPEHVDVGLQHRVEDHDRRILVVVVDYRGHRRHRYRVLAEGHRGEQADGQSQCEEIETPIADEPVHLLNQGSRASRRVRPLVGFTGSIEPISRRRRPSASRLRVMAPFSTTEILPVSSDTTTISASEANESPIAARWRVPRRSRTVPSSGSGSRHPAARIWLPRMMTAPSWSGELGKNRDCRNSLDTSPLMRTPVAA